MTTITREQFEAAVQAAGVRSPYAGEALQRALTAIGITIAEPEPPAAMVKLAREIAERLPGFDNDFGARKNAALAALKYAALAMDMIVSENGAARGGAVQWQIYKAFMEKIGAK